MASIINDLNNQFAATVGNYQALGGSNNFLTSLDNMNMIKEYEVNKDTQKARQNINAIIESINLG